MLAFFSISNMDNVWTAWNKSPMRIPPPSNVGHHKIDQTAVPHSSTRNHGSSDLMTYWVVYNLQYSFSP